MTMELSLNILKGCISEIDNAIHDYHDNVTAGMHDVYGVLNYEDGLIKARAMLVKRHNELLKVWRENQ